MSLFSFLVHGLNVEPGSSELLSRKLRRFQEKIVEYVINGSPHILLDAPVGSGKTLAALAAAQASGGPTILTYPTNSLAEDQARSVSALLENHYCVEVRRLDTNTLEWVTSDETRGKGHRFGLVLVNGDVLDIAVEKSTAKGTVLRNLLEKLELQYGRNWIMLTNVDLLVNTLTGKYKYSRSILERLLATRLVVLDEFHFYRGPSLAAVAWTASFIVHGKGSVLAMSGTLADPGKGTLPECVEVKELGAEKEEWPQVRWEVEVRMKKDPTAGAYDATAHNTLIEKVVGEVESLINEKPQNSASKNPAPIAVVILNSPIDAMAVAHKLQESDKLKRFDIKVFEAHGLMSAAERHYELWTGNVVVGTSAIEVGIDFRTHILVAQAWDSYSFVQRFGRVGRSELGVATFFVPEYLINVVAKKVKMTNALSYQEFIEIIKNYLEPVRAYGEFVSSHNGKYIMTTLMREVLKNKFVTEDASLFVENFLRKRVEPQFLKEVTSRLYNRISECLMKSGSSLVREAGLNVPAIINVGEKYWFMEVDLVDAARWGSLELLNTDRIFRLGVEVPLRFREAPAVLVRVDLDRHTPYRLEVALATRPLGQTGLQVVEGAGNLQLQTPPDIVRKMAEGLLCYRTTLYKLHEIGDWRIRGIHTPEGHVVLLGTNALLAQHLIEGR